MNDEYMNYIKTLHSVFEQRFTAVYRESNTRRRARLLPFIQAIYRRWYYAALIEETPFTPANMMESINLEFGNLPDTCPVAILRGKNKYNGVDVDIIEYSLEKHPVVADMRIIMDYCNPSIELCDEDCFNDEQALEASELLGLKDPHYASFLLEICLWMGLLKKIPSLYANHVRVSKESEEILAAPDELIFKEIVDAAVKMSTFSLNTLIPLPESIFTESFVYSLLTEPIEVDEIFQRVYDVIGFTVDDLMDIDMEDLDDADVAFLSGTYMMGLVLDKFFLTPFGHFLKLLRPFYVIPFDFEEEIKVFLDVAFRDEELVTAFFAPCSSYSLTPMGIRFFNVIPDADNYIDVSKTLPFEFLNDFLFNNPQNMEDIIHSKLAPPPEMNPFASGKVFVFKVKMESDPALWFNLEIPSDLPLHRLYTETVARFMLTRNDDYSFFHDERENRFVEYVSPKNAKHSRKTTDIPLNKLDFDYKKKMLLVIYNQTSDFGGNFMVKPNKITLHISFDMDGAKPKEPGKPYPFITRMSKAMKMMHETND